MNMGSKNRASDDARAKARALQRAKAAAAQRERVEKEMAKDAALIKAMEQKLAKKPQNNENQSFQLKSTLYYDSNNSSGGSIGEPEGIKKSVPLDMEGRYNSHQNLEESMFSSSPQLNSEQYGSPMSSLNNIGDNHDDDDDETDSYDNMMSNDDEDMSEELFVEKVVKIQSIFRGHIGRSVISIRKERATDKLQVMKAIAIQSAIRRKLARRRQQQFKTQSREDAIAKLRKEKLQKEKENRIKVKPAMNINEPLTIIHKRSAILDKYQLSPSSSQNNHSSSSTPEQKHPRQNNSSKLESLDQNKRNGDEKEVLEEEWPDDFEDISVARQAVQNIISRADYY